MKAYAIQVAAGLAVATMLGGSAQAQGKDIVDTAVAAGQFKTLAAALKAAGLIETLKGPGPFTVFAPTNAAFAALPAGTVDMLLKPENKAKLQKVLTAHVVPGKLSGSELVKMAKAHGGMYKMRTASGDTLVAEVKGKNLYIVDESGVAAKVVIADVNQSNGVIHVVNKVLVPK